MVDRCIGNINMIYILERLREYIFWRGWESASAYRRQLKSFVALKGAVQILINFFVQCDFRQALSLCPTLTLTENHFFAPIYRILSYKKKLTMITRWHCSISGGSWWFSRSACYIIYLLPLHILFCIPVILFEILTLRRPCKKDEWKISNNNYYCYSRYSLC